jgi:diguanylate cyclase (GGDEF)-like protein
MGKRNKEYFSLDLISDPFIVLRHDGMICDLNLSCSELLGSRKTQLIGQNFKNIEKFSTLREKVDQTIVDKKEAIERILIDGRNFEVCILPFTTDQQTYFVRIILKDITNFLRLETELLKRNKELIIINNLSSVFISSDNLDLVMEDLMDKVLLITDFPSGWLLLKEDDKFLLKMHRGISSELSKKIENGALTSLCADMMKFEEPLFVAESSDIRQMPFLNEEDILFMVVIPLVNERQIMGLFFLANRTENNFDFDTASLLTLVGNHATLIIDKIRLFQETRRLAITDGLTGLYNVRYFYKTLDLEIARTNRYGDPFSLMLFDIDNFKHLNDTYGHQAGDEVLQALAKILKSVSRETDTVVRYGGEEFIIILPNTPEDETIFLADRIRNAVEENTFIVNSKEKVNITLSGGIASYPKNAKDAKFLLNAADTALYSAKTAGKNVVYCFKGISQ